jgi:capsular polysaccharide biosynthesis protein
LYQNYLRKVEEARVSEDMNRNKITSIAVIEAASPPQLPAGPGKKIKLLLVFGFATMGGLGLAFAVDLASRRFFSDEQVENTLGIPVLASVPLHRS